MQELKADKMPVAVHIKMTEFTNHHVKLNKGDKIYLFSDGYPDQFGGAKGKKFKYKAFRRLLVNTSGLSMPDQKEQVEKELNSWMSWEGKQYEQIDDITVVGLQVE